MGDGRSEEPQLRLESSQCTYGSWVNRPGSVGEDDSKIGEEGVLVVSVRCGKERDMTRGWQNVLGTPRLAILSHACSRDEKWSDCAVWCADTLCASVHAVWAGVLFTSLKLIIMFSATWSHSPLGLYVWVPYRFFSDPGPRKDQCPCANLFAYSATFREIAIHKSLFPFSLHTMSLHPDMKMIRLVNCSDSHCISFIIFWILGRICDVACPGKTFHSNSIGSPSTRSNFRCWEVLVNHSILFFLRLWTLGMDSSCPDTIMNLRIHRLLLWMLCQSTKLSFAKNVVASRSQIYLEFLFDIWSTSSSHRTLVLSIVVADFW